ncbi:MAG TPA: hypothetical protein VMZ03_00025 [Chitinophagaceae bacterium]|nr:hypothetical protein [Chitinophagaceae bacterium]
MQSIPTYISLLFIVISFFTIAFFYLAAHRSWIPVIVLLIWSGLHCVLALNGFYLVTDGVPPRTILFLLPTIIAIILLFTVGKKFTLSLDIKWLTILHMVRVLVEIGIFLLLQKKLVPELMTFEGRNFDILSGITAPFVFYFGFIRKTLSRKMLLAWNFLCLALLLNVLINAVLAIPSAFQQQAFDQPNVGVLYFPVVLLPVLIVALVLYSHLVCIVRLWVPVESPSLQSFSRS